MTETRFEFGVLGPLRASLDASPMSLGGPKQRAVLAMLVINRNRPVGTESLLNAVWEESPPPGARASLHTYVSNLRKLLGTAGPASSDVLVNVPPGYRLDVADSSCDIGRFIIEKNAGVQEAAAGRFEQASGHLSAALAEWRGPVLEDLRDFGFVDAFATALIEEKIVAHTSHAEVEIACGRASSVIGVLETLVAEHFYREPLWIQLMSAYYLAGRQSDALDSYHRLAAVLADDLGIDPSPEVCSLHERILRQEPLNVRRVAQTTAVDAVSGINRHKTVNAKSAYARLRDTSGRVHRLRGAATRIGRLADNDIVLEDANVSRHHAVIIDTGASFVITDMKSANGVEVQHQRIRGTVALHDGDSIRICQHQFTFEIQSREADDLDAPGSAAGP
jgi:DNA-binding SARP family transcriptional activator